MLQLAEREGLEIVEIRRESHSAKETGQRPVFNEIIDEIKQIELLSDTDSNLENKLDKIWNFLEIKTKKNGTDMSKFKSAVNPKIKDLVDKLSNKSKNPTVWGRRRLVCNLWD